jgi:predicted nucleic acid-binding protein
LASISRCVAPGRILLIERNLRRFYWSLIARLRYQLPYFFSLDLERALQLSLDLGESATLALAMERIEALVILDRWKARKVVNESI